MPAFLREIFSSVQGEGLYVGCRQIFIRFAGCNLNCAYCDTPRDRPPACRVELTPGKKDFAFLPNPLTAGQVAEEAARVNFFRHHSISLTGGEPLLYDEFLLTLIPLLPSSYRGVYLETNGTLPRELARVIDLVEIVAMDIKLPGVAGGHPLWDVHGEFLRVATKKEVFVKLVVDGNTPFAELEKAFLLVREVGDIPVVIQPVTLPGGGLAAGAEFLHGIQRYAMKFLTDVRVVPQMHKLLKFM